MRVKWGSTLSKQFSVMNGVKQGGVLSPILYVVYTDGLLERLKNTGVGCHMGSRFVEALAYADDIILLAPCKSALSILIGVCENYAAEYDIMFNGDKSKLLFFKGRSSVMIPSEIMVNGQIVGVSDKAAHLGHTISTTDCDCITMAQRIISGNVLICLLQILNSYIVVLNLSYLISFVAAFMGHHCGI